MYDVEAMGVSPHGALVSIGACLFNPFKLQDPVDTFYTIVDPESWERFGQKVNRKVKAWWDEQPAAVRAVLESPEIMPVPLDEAMRLFMQWVTGDGDEAYTLWSNTSTYDANMIQFTMRDVNLPLFPHNSFKNCRDIFWLPMSTGVIRYKDLTSMKKKVYQGDSGLKHHAKDDAIRQAKIMQASIDFFLHVKQEQ